MSDQKPAALTMGFSPASAVATWRLDASGLFDCYTYWPTEEIRFTSETYEAKNVPYKPRNVDFGNARGIPRDGFAVVILVVPSIKDVARMCQRLRSSISKSTLILVDVSGGIGPLQRHVHVALPKVTIAGLILDIDAELTRSDKAPGFWEVLHRPDSVQSSSIFAHIEPSGLKSQATLEQAWTSARFPATHSKSATLFGKLQWERTISVVAFELMSIVLDTPQITRLVSSVVAKPLIEGLVSELVLVATASGVKGLPSKSQLVQQSTKTVRKAPADYRRAPGASRAYYDFDRGAMVPIDFLLLLPILLSDELSKGPPTPYLEAMYAFMTQLLELNAERSSGEKRSLLFQRATVENLKSEPAAATPELIAEVRAKALEEARVQARQEVQSQIQPMVQEQVHAQIRTRVAEAEERAESSSEEARKALTEAQVLRRQLQQTQSALAELQEQNTRELQRHTASMTELQSRNSQLQAALTRAESPNVAKEHALVQREQALAAREAEIARRMMGSAAPSPAPPGVNGVVPNGNVAYGGYPPISRTSTMANIPNMNGNVNGNINANINGPNGPNGPTARHSPSIDLQQSGVPSASITGRRASAIRRGSAAAAAAAMTAPGSIPGLDGGPMPGVGNIGINGGRRNSRPNGNAGPVGVSQSPAPVEDIDMMSLTGRRRYSLVNSSYPHQQQKVASPRGPADFSQKFQLDSIMDAGTDRFSFVSRGVSRPTDPNLSSDSAIHQRQFAHGSSNLMGNGHRTSIPADLTTGSRQHSIGMASQHPKPPVVDVTDFDGFNMGGPDGRFSNGSSSGSHGSSGAAQSSPSRSHSGTPPTPHGLDPTPGVASSGPGQKLAPSVFINLS